MANKSETNGNNAGSFKAGKNIIIAGIAVIILLLVAVVVLLLTRGTGEMGKKEVTQEEDKRNVLVTEDNVKEVAEDFFSQEYVPQGYFSATMSNVWHFKTGDAESEDAYVANDKANSNDVFFDVFLSEDESNPIYQSPVIPLGSELNKIKLDTELKQGTYDCVMVYHLVDEEQNTLSTVRVGLTIEVEQ